MGADALDLLETVVCAHCASEQRVATDRDVWACVSCLVKNDRTTTDQGPQRVD